MTAELDFTRLVQQVRAGDNAAAELVRKYEKEVRREVRFLLRDPSLRPVLDSLDICQSVLGSFFVRAALGQYELDKPEQLKRLLVTITRNKIADLTRKHQAQRRDRRRECTVGDREFAAPGASPSVVVGNAELLQEVRRRLSDEERQLAELRAAGWEWAEIATQVGGTAEARRKQLARSLNRIAQDLGLEETSP